MLKRIAACIFLTACSTLPACTTINNVTASPEARRDMLRGDIAVFHRAMDRGYMSDALEHVSPYSKNLLIEKVEAEKGDERVVEKKVEKVDFNADVDEATVSVSVRYFRKPNMIVMERKEEEQWSYSKSSGWLWEKSERVGSSDADKPTTLNGIL